MLNIQLFWDDLSGPTGH